ncbi:hypothetical protein POM88_018284 [Heracleum sosnowskyi]|uniref:Uncharacterized protein n=1 Tax=Heracleum sosnowskyi TaxID=360622 RepID=A0AAD8MZ07_9APIA|nr:hypothetical protein POM88_018284 [Heracleum sosnowskyi]
MDHSQITTDEKGKTSLIEEEEKEEIETLKSRIRGHDLFRLLIQKHMECLKVSVGANEDVRTTFEVADDTECPHNAQQTPDLDKLMKVHCMALGKLKEDMEIEFQETLSFINDMYLELN